MKSLLSIDEQAYLLQVVNGKNGNIEPLTKNHSYSDIGIELKNLIQDGYIEYKKDELFLTDKGKAMLDNLHASLKRKKKGWIELKIDEKVEPCPENYIYLPSESEIERIIKKDIHQHH